MVLNDPTLPLYRLQRVGRMFRFDYECEAHGNEPPPHSGLRLRSYVPVFCMKGAVQVRVPKSDLFPDGVALKIMFETGDSTLVGTVEENLAIIDEALGGIA